MLLTDKKGQLYRPIQDPKTTSKFCLYRFWSHSEWLLSGCVSVSEKGDTRSGKASSKDSSCEYGVGLNRFCQDSWVLMEATSGEGALVGSSTDT